MIKHFVSRLSIKLKFKLGAGVILLLFCTSVSIVGYLYLKDLLIKDIYRETEIFIGTADATRTYVKDVLRPKILPILSEGEFIPHAMSTTFVGREIMKRLQVRFPDFIYKRAAPNPMNPVNMADDFENEMIQWFNQNPDEKEWYGIIAKGDGSYYARMKSITAEKECLLCHGNPQEAPEGVKRIYGTGGGFGYKIGQVVAADTVYIPVDVTLEKIKSFGWEIFVFSLGSLFAIMGMFYMLFNRTVVTELKGLLRSFKSITGVPEITDEDSASDEIDQLKSSFEKVADDLRHSHLELLRSEAKYRIIFEASQDAILVVGEESRVEDINPTGIKLFGFKSREEATGIETFYQIFWDTREAESFYRTILKDGFVKDFETSMVNRDGKRMETVVSATSRKNDAGGFSGFDMVIRDVTEKKRMQRYLARAEKLASVGELAAGVAHELNTPLGVISCYADLVGRYEKENIQVKKDMEVIKKHADQCKEIVKALLNFSRVSEPKKEPADLNKLIREVLDILLLKIKKEKIRITCSMEQKLPMVTVDIQQIRQVLLNILINAVQAIDDVGEISISCTREGDKIVIGIRDNGSGISPIYIDRIFDPFFTTKEPGSGTGLGLSVSYGIVKSHGGDIEVTSEAGAGSLFRIILPMDNAFSNG